MESKKLIIIGCVIGVILLSVIGYFVYKKATAAPAVQKQDEMLDTTLPEADASIQVTVVKSRVKDNTIIIRATGLAGKIVSVGYEIQYESEGVGKGVTSGSKPIDVVGKDEFEREVYLGTCSKNVCKPDLGVTKVSVVLEFTDTADKKTQFSKDFEL